MTPSQPKSGEMRDSNCGLSVGRSSSEDLPPALSDAARDVLSERERQKTVEGWSPDHDDYHRLGELANAAACYAATHRPFKAVSGVGRGYEPYTAYRDLWPWRDEWWKPKTPRENLVRAGALVLAEIERLDRAAIALATKETT